MKLLRCAIIDDEPAAINILKEFISEVPELIFSFSSTNALSALHSFEDEQIDLLFLDINMPKVSGLNFTKLLSNANKPTFIILTTAYTNFATLSYEYNIFDYLVKPIAFERFLKTIKKINDVRHSYNDNKQFFFVRVDSKNNNIKINCNDIVYIEGMKNYVKILTNKESIIALLNLKDLEEKLMPNRFMRVHRSFIVSLDKITRVDGNRIFLTNSEGYIQIGMSYKKAVSDYLSKNFI